MLYNIGEFIINYRKELMLCVEIVITIILLFKKSKVKVVDNVLVPVVCALPSIIKQAESLFPDSKSGKDKLNFVLHAAINLIVLNNDVSIDEAEFRYLDKINRLVEDILSCPTKKGD